MEIVLMSDPDPLIGQSQVYSTSFSLDGRSLLYLSILLINSDGSNPQLIADRASYPSWVK